MKILIASITTLIFSGCLINNKESSSGSENTRTLQPSYSARLIRAYYEPEDVDNQIILSIDTTELPENLKPYLKHDIYFNIDSISLPQDSLVFNLNNEFDFDIDSSFLKLTHEYRADEEAYLSIFDEGIIESWDSEIFTYLPGYLHAHIDSSKVTYSSCIRLQRDRDGTYYGHSISYGLSCRQYELFRTLVNSKLKKTGPENKLGEFHKIELNITWE